MSYQLFLLLGLTGIININVLLHSETKGAIKRSVTQWFAQQPAVFDN